MNMHNEGWTYYPDKDDRRLVELIFVDVDRRGDWFHPDEDDVRRACVDFGLNPERMLDIIDSRNKDVHTVFINVPVYRKHEKER